MKDRTGLWIAHYIHLPLRLHVYPLNSSPEQCLLEKMQYLLPSQALGSISSLRNQY